MTDKRTNFTEMFRAVLLDVSMEYPQSAARVYLLPVSVQSTTVTSVEDDWEEHSGHGKCAMRLSVIGTVKILQLQQKVFFSSII